MNNRTRVVLAGRVSAAPSRVNGFAADHDRRFTSDWAKDNARRAAGQEAERQRMADYYARLTHDQEERDNKEARERFAEAQRKRWGGSKTE